MSKITSARRGLRRFSSFKSAFPARNPIPIRLAVFFDNSRLGQWSWSEFLAGNVPLSGTDSQCLYLLSRLSMVEGVQLLAFFKGDLPATSPSWIRRVKSQTQAVSHARNCGAQLFLTNNRNQPEALRELISCSTDVGIPVMLWDQNGLSRIVRDMLARASIVRRVVCVSFSQADSVRDHPVFNKTSVIYNALLPFAAADPKSRRRRGGVCFLGATIAEKGFHHVAAAWPRIRSSFPEAILTIIGSSLLYDRNRTVGGLGLADAEFERHYLIPHFGETPAEAAAQGVQIRGLMTPCELRGLLREQQIVVVNPSVSRGGCFETFCVSAIDAQAEGCAVVGGRRFGLRETVQNGKTGILITRESQLAEVVCGLIRHPTQSEKLGQAGAQWVQSAFNPDHISADWCVLLRDIVMSQPARLVPFSFGRATAKDYARPVLRLVRTLSELRTGLK